MAINPDEDTEFNDALRKHGILPPRPPTPPTPPPPESPGLDELLDDFTSAELQELAEDTRDEATERLIEDIRRQKISEAQDIARKARFGRVYPIGRDDYTREVTEASQVDEEGDTEGKGTPVVCFLYKDGLPQCERAHDFVRVLAQRHPRTKFVSIIGDKCIPNLPDSRLPMFIIYRKGEVLTQLIAWSARRQGTIDGLSLR
ncbi:hypothetical protein HGRIS_013645 [Hohenbuehelia grisea]|uniref:Phosducin domain-containing protein n=1 Tax=Hohenbuehelia grisea TaxID=104357 RepID=A0ABR3IWF2_9AGAR